MNTRSLTITLGPDWRSALRKAGRSATATTYQGETLNFETPGAFLVASRSVAGRLSRPCSRTEEPSACANSRAVSDAM